MKKKVKMKWKKTFIIVFLVVVASVRAHDAKHHSIAVEANDVVQASEDYSYYDEEFYDGSYENYEWVNFKLFYEKFKLVTYSLKVLVNLKMLLEAFK